MFAHVADIRAQADSCEREEEGPARKIREARELLLVKDVGGGDGGDEQEAEDELRELVPEECGFIPDAGGFFFARPVDCVTENYEADHGVAGCFCEDGYFAGGIGINISGGGDFGGVVDAEAGPETVAQVAHVEPVTDERKNKERNRTEREYGGDGEGGIFFVGVDGALGGDDGRDAADRGAHCQQSGELWFEAEGFAEGGHEGKRKSDFDRDKDETDAAELEDVAKKKTRTEENDSGFEPEFVRGEAGFEGGGDAGGVGYHEAEKDGPENVFDIWKGEVVRASVLGDRALDEFSGITDGYEQQKAGDELADAFKDAERLRLGECDACGHFLFILLGGVVAYFRG